MAQRRKVTTYGKVSRKPMFTTEASFAQATETELLDAQNIHQGRMGKISQALKGAIHTPEDRPKKESLERKPGLSTLRRHQRDGSRKAFGDARLPTFVPNDNAPNDHIFDVPSSDDELQQSTSTLYTSLRKRRKVNPVVAKQEDVLVYDDASLQRHIALETGIRLTQSPPVSSKAIVAIRSQPSSNAAKLSRKARPSDRSEKQSKAAKVPMSRKKGLGGPRASAKTQGTMDNAEPSLETLGDNRATHIPRTPPRKKHKASHSTAVSSIGPASLKKTPSTASPSTLDNDGGRVTTPTTDHQPPATPPKSIPHKETNTTPRQRELWKRLLSVGDASSASPSTINLPDLVLSDEMPKTSEKHTVASNCNISWASNELSTSKVRPRRIIDSLHPPDHRQGSVHNDSDDSSESYGSDSLSETVQSEASVLNGAVTGQTSPSADSLSRVHQCRDQALTSAPPTIQSLHGAGLKVTYARQRSYLTDNDLDDVAMLSMPVTQESFTGTTGRRRGLREGLASTSQPLQTLEQELGDSQESQGGAMRSIHELREAGGNVRLVGELEAILDDLEDEHPSSSSLRRTRFIDLVSKLQEPSKCRLFLDQGMEARLLVHADTCADLITKSLLAAAILLLLAGSTSTLFLAQASTPRIVNFLIGLLGLNHDLASQAKLREFNLSKYARQEYRDTCYSISASTAWRAGKPTILTCHVLALQCLEYLVRQTRESGSLSNLLSAYAIRRIVASSIPIFTAPLPPRTTMSEIHVELATSILESCTISNSTECQESLWEGDTLERVAGLLPLLNSWDENECATSRALTLRLYVNLTNNSPGLCEDFSTPGNVEVMFKMIVTRFEELADPASKNRHQILRDNLILSLGAFVNLTESSDIVRRLVLNLYHQGRDYLDILLELFMTKSKIAAEVILSCFPLRTG